MLSSVDGISHLQWTQNLPLCLEAYNNLTCLISYPFSFDPFIFWVFFAIIIFIIMPLFLYYLTKKPLIMIGYYFFTSIPFVYDKLGFYSQFMLSFLLVYFIYAKNNLVKAIVCCIFIILSLLGLIIHRMQFELIIVFLVIEFVLFLQKKFDWSKYFVVFGFVQDLRNIGYSKQVTGNVFPSVILYYAYHLLVRPMLFVFSIPAFIYILVSKDYRKLLWFFVLVFGGIYLWFWDGFANTSILRVWTFIGFVLLVPFLDWVSLKSKNTKILFFVMGFVWFCYQLNSWLLFKGLY